MSEQTNGSTPTPLKLSSLRQWSEDHMAAIFEAATLEDAVKAIADSFPDNVRATLNGAPLARSSIDKMVAVMRPTPQGGLKVHWKEGCEVANDPYNRNGTFGGFYCITGLRKPHPETGEIVPFIRYKTVIVKIESLSEDVSYDSRKITDLTFVGSDKPAEL
ncbi:hypothetical protein FB446DRAFT_715016 [Lentinula raphanica]|nr:hypothetical protein FB446DRAFT_715016 [Lentinula raphanica]